MWPACAGCGSTGILACENCQLLLSCDVWHKCLSCGGLMRSWCWEWNKLCSPGGKVKHSQAAIAAANLHTVKTCVNRGTIKLTASLVTHTTHTYIHTYTYTHTKFLHHSCMEWTVPSLHILFLLILSSSYYHLLITESCSLAGADSLDSLVESVGGASETPLPVESWNSGSTDPLQPPSWRTHANSDRDVLQDVR